MNKRDTKVTAKLCIEDLSSISDDGKQRLATRLASRLTNNGNLIVQVDHQRRQLHNRDIALERIETLVTDALRRDPKPRRATRPSKSARDKRLAAKKHRSFLKNRRGTINKNEE